jgi:hypothetical protein
LLQLAALIKFDVRRRDYFDPYSSRSEIQIGLFRQRSGYQSPLGRSVGMVLPNAHQPRVPKKASYTRLNECAGVLEVGRLGGGEHPPIRE